MSETPAADNNVGSLPELTASKSWSTSSIDKTLETEKVAVTEVDSEEDVNIGIIENTEDVAIQVEQLPRFEFRFINNSKLSRRTMTQCCPPSRSVRSSLVLV
jgi:hypothetical protein